MNTFAAVIEGKADLADILFLAAMILFIIGAVVAAMQHAIVYVIVCAGLACVALAWLVL